MQKKYIILPTLLLIIGLTSQTIFAQHSKDVTDPEEMRQIYIEMLNENGANFEAKEDYLKEKAVQDEIAQILKDIQSNNFKVDQTLPKKSEIEDHKQYPLITNKEPHQSKPMSKDEIEDKKIAIEEEIQRQKELEIPAYIVQPGDQLREITGLLSLNFKEIVFLNRLYYDGQKKDDYPENSDAVDLDQYYPLIVGDILVGILPETPHQNPTENGSYKHNVSNRQRMLKGIQHKAIETIQNHALNLSPDKLQSIYDQIYLAQDKEEIEYIVNQALSYNSNEIVAMTDEIDNSYEDQVAIKKDIENEKTSAVNRLLAYQITQEQYNQLVAEIRACQTINEIDSVLWIAESLSKDNQSTTQESETSKDNLTTNEITEVSKTHSETKTLDS